MVKEIQLTRGRVALVDDEDYERLNQYNWHIKDCGGCLYAATHLPQTNKLQFMHRMILDIPKGKVPDHINSNGLDNRKSNLRICSKAENQHNQKIHSEAKSSQFKGVYLDKRWGKWIARIGINGKQIYLGSFNNERIAASAYDMAAKKHYGEFANLNLKEA